MDILDRVSAEERYRVALVVRKALRSGILTRATRCGWCGSEQGTMHGHHPDYARPLMLVWICGPYHRRHHATYADERRIAQALQAPVYVELDACGEEAPEKFPAEDGPSVTK